MWQLYVNYTITILSHTPCDRVLSWCDRCMSSNYTIKILSHTHCDLVLSWCDSCMSIIPSQYCHVHNMTKFCLDVRADYQLYHHNTVMYTLWLSSVLMWQLYVNYTITILSRTPCDWVLSDVPAEYQLYQHNTVTYTLWLSSVLMWQLYVPYTITILSRTQYDRVLSWCESWISIIPSQYCHVHLVTEFCLDVTAVCQLYHHNTVTYTLWLSSVLMCQLNINYTIKILSHTPCDLVLSWFDSWISIIPSQYCHIHLVT
jgi:hypothetical protein